MSADAGMDAGSVQVNEVPSDDVENEPATEPSGAPASTGVVTVTCGDVSVVGPEGAVIVVVCDDDDTAAAVNGTDDPLMTDSPSDDPPPVVEPETPEPNPALEPEPLAPSPSAEPESDPSETETEIEPPEPEPTLEPESPEPDPSVEPNPSVEPESDPTETETETDPPEPPSLCRPVDTLERLPARAAVLSSAAGSPTPQPVFVRDVFDRFRSGCGGCHVDQGLGNLKVSEATFTSLVDREVIARIVSDDLAKVMPPGRPYSGRPAQDPIRELVDLLTQWRDAVEPIIASGAATPQVYFPPAQGPSTDVSPYLLTPELGAAITNLGTCIPDPALVNTEATKSVELDELFALAAELPKNLRDTDLFTLDSAELARHGVISYAPTYPLFSDDAGKMRYVRVPRGQTITFDPDTQEFDIPPNTRFYKTFLKKVKDSEGNDRWRKIETRLIVSRPDIVLPDGTRQPTALYGSYQWDMTSEAEALLVEDPLRNGEPFRDRLFLYQTDEVGAQAMLATPPVDLERQLAEQGLARNYGIPGGQRCLDCHRGSVQHSFVLGFGPLQVNRQPAGEQGVWDAPNPDDLTQLQRLIDYGVISGIGDPSDPEEVLPLASTQQVLPRNQFEVNAQAYMVGNCAICHNPDGLASYENPVLRNVLDMWPDQDGGIFGFPLDRFSPRIKRGLGGAMRIPYVSPALSDRKNGDALGTIGKTYGVRDADGVFATLPLEAPWRSLIYRNVDTPFDYTDDSALFPKMPRHVPGYDQRVPRIMGEWMASIPAKLAPDLIDDGSPQDTEQPYIEVFPEDADYEAALAEAQLRLEQYHNGGRFNCRPFVECAPTNSCSNRCVDNRDIVAHEVLETIERGTPGGVLTPLDETNDGVPDRPHWVNTDLTEAALDHWEPRRPDWDTVLLGTSTSAGSEGAAGSSGASSDPPAPVVSSPAEAEVVELLQDVLFTDEFREFALGERPMTFWEPKPECDLSDLPTGLSYSGTGPSNWLKVTDQDLSQALYFQSPGEAIFSNICANCHGPQADSTGRQAAGVALMSGGETRVANLRDGLLGPGNIEEQFGPYATAERSSLDLAARYVGWMALGGTQRRVPGPILELVRRTPVYGMSRVFSAGVEATSANMLEVGVALCGQLLGYNNGTKKFDLNQGSIDHAINIDTNAKSSLLGLTGDAEMWRDVCTYNNLPPVLLVDSFQNVVARLNYFSSDGRLLYPDDAPVGDHLGNSVLGVHADNKQPWCVAAAEDGSAPPFAEVWQATHEGAFPLCPPELAVEREHVVGWVYAWDDARTRRWARRGAINAGMAVLAYLMDVQAGLAPHPPYNACEQRPLP